MIVNQCVILVQEQIDTLWQLAQLGCELKYPGLYSFKILQLLQICLNNFLVIFQKIGQGSLKRNLINFRQP